VMTLVSRRDGMAEVRLCCCKHSPYAWPEWFDLSHRPDNTFLLVHNT
jgi:hypothetical protein